MKTKDDMILFKTKETNEINIQLELYQQQNSKLLNENNHLKHFNDSILIAENDLNQTKRKTHALESKLLQTNELMSSMNMDRLLLTEESVEMENINEGKYQSSVTMVVIIVKNRFFIRAFLSYCLFLNHSFQTSPNSSTNLFKNILSILQQQQQQQ